MIEHLENPDALTSLFGEGFDISEVDLHEAVIHRDGPSLRLRFDIFQVPRSQPARWPTGANITQIVLRADQIDRLQIAGFTTHCRGILRTSRDQGIQLIEFNADGCSLACSFSWLRIERISGYVNAQSPVANHAA